MTVELEKLGIWWLKVGSCRHVGSSVILERMEGGETRCIATSHRQIKLVAAISPGRSLGYWIVLTRERGR